MEWIWFNVKQRRRPSIVNMSHHGPRNQFWNDQASRVRSPLLVTDYTYWSLLSLSRREYTLRYATYNPHGEPICEMEIDL